MNIGLFTDTYFPQISGVATSIQTLKNVLEDRGHSVFIFTTTDPHLPKGAIEPNVFRVASVPFVSFTDRRIAFRGVFQATKIAKEVQLDIVHTQTEFSMGMIGKYVSKSLNIPAIHTYHTNYEDYLHYVLNGHLLKPYHVKQFIKAYLHSMQGVIAPSEQTEKTLKGYGVKTPMRIISTGVDLNSINENPKRNVRQDLGLSEDDIILLTLSRVAPEKKIDQLIKSMPQIIKKIPQVKLVIAGDGPAMEDLQSLTRELNLTHQVIFSGNVEHSDVGNYYRMANLFVSASDTETQGLTYIEALAAGTPCVVFKTDYTEEIFDKPELGRIFKTQDEMIREIIELLNKKEFSIPQDILDKTLNKVTAASFGENVEKFYEDAINELKTNEVKNDKN